FPRGQNVVAVPSECGRTHDTFGNSPWVCCDDLKGVAAILRSQNIDIAMDHFGCGPEHNEDVAVFCGHDVEAATSAHPSFLGDGGALSVERCPIVVRACDPDLAVLFAITGLRRVPSDIHVSVTVGGN